MLWLLNDLLWGVPLSVLKVLKIWLPWLLIYMRIHEMFNVTDRRDTNFGVDFLSLFFHCYLKSWDSPNILFKYMYGSLSDTWNFKPSSCFHERCETVHVTDGHFGKKYNFDNTPAEKWFGLRIFVPWNFLKNLISTIWDSFHGGASPSSLPFLQCHGRTKCYPLTDHTRLGPSSIIPCKHQWTLKECSLCLFVSGMEHGEHDLHPDVDQASGQRRLSGRLQRAPVFGSCRQFSEGGVTFIQGFLWYSAWCTCRVNNLRSIIC